MFSGGGRPQITGAGRLLWLRLTQQFNTTPTTTVGAGGTNAKTRLCLSVCRQRVGEGAVIRFFRLACSWSVALTDGSNTVILVAQGNKCLFTKVIHTLSTAFVNFQGSLRTPAIMPSTVRLRIRTSTAIDNGLSIFIGRVGMRQMTQLYGSGPTGGPSVVGFSGNTKTFVPDSWTSAITNTAGAFQRLFQRWFLSQAIGLLLPSSVSPSIPDSLIA